MNWIHRHICRSAHWRKRLEEKLLPWALGGVDLGANVLEVGPGPGLATDILRRRFANLTCIEIDPLLAGSLSERMEGTKYQDHRQHHGIFRDVLTGIIFP